MKDLFLWENQRKTWGNGNSERGNVGVIYREIGENACQENLSIIQFSNLIIVHHNGKRRGINLLSIYTRKRSSTKELGGKV